MNKPDPQNTLRPSERITETIAALGDWRGAALAHLRALIHEAVPGISEEWKWETPVFTAKGRVCAAGIFKDHVKLNFFKGASLSDPHGLFNAGLDAKATRAIDLFEGGTIDEIALKELIRSAANFNLPGKKG